jgi:hypothetical protein
LSVQEAHAFDAVDVNAALGVEVKLAEGSHDVRLVALRLRLELTEPTIAIKTICWQAQREILRQDSEGTAAYCQHA